MNNLSHEIRTPLNIILGFTDIIANLNTNNIEIQGEQISNLIRNSANRFLLVMDDLIELSLLLAGDEIGIKKERVNIEEIFSALNNYFDDNILLKNKKIVIICSHPKTSLNIFSDGKRLKHILYHLIDNAIKFSTNDKVIYGYELSTDKESVEFFVMNDSPEISEENGLKIFDIFDKQEKIGKDFNFGLGIGLPLAKKLAEMLGGHIRFESNSNRVTFFVKIPTK